ncbi:AzlD family protein [Jiella pelagia]|uniref:AzlD domain-containing protein n=1 Tax=Jiella pelagia TaxID=2986949 RepID=A0ABY7BYT9_9HYPH|nr:AzlD domain-containing protein [Jiella pelagia]WAP68151.1 AzlD domain-containing protein [Jiella pelagia]
MNGEALLSDTGWSIGSIWFVMLAAGALTYLTRFGGHILISLLGTIPPRASAALDAVPAAVMTAIVAPVLVSGDWPERVAIVVCLILSLRLPLIAVVVIGTAMVAGARALGL